ncbi:MAG: undecaprenyl-diphosphate phosphatase, partial [Candidatus Margulisiibacteriota bacterium]
LLGVIQGLTEFLPVSSSGHLVLAQKLLGLPVNLAFDVIVHIATALAVIIYFWSDILEIIKWFFVGFYKIITRNMSFRETYNRIAFFKMSILLLAATFFTAVIGFAFKDFFESLFSSTLAVGCFLLLTAALILLAEWIGTGTKGMDRMGLKDAIIIGLAQGAAIAPGLSRSGTTISASLMRGLNRKLAARFSFLLSVPAILGAGLLQAPDIMAASSSQAGVWALVFGGIAAFVSGYLAIKLFMTIIQRTSIRVFAYYCVIVGSIVVLSHFR